MTTEYENAASRRLSDLLVEKCPEIQSCQFVVKAPGRVNIIGEHIDYSDYPVLPMALAQSVYIAVSSQPSASQPKVTIMSESETLEQYESDFETALQFAANGPPCPIEWYHYVLCGLRGYSDYAKQHFPNWNVPSMHLLVGYGNDAAYLPISAGLSSSSALVVAAAMAVMRASNTFVESRLLGDMCAKCERLIGTMGGGMDQAACLLADSSAIMIEFTKPILTTTPLTIPTGAVFCIADSGARLNKAATPDFNTRVMQCREAAKILLNRLKTTPISKDKSVTLRHVQIEYGKSEPGQMLGPDSPFEEAFSGNLRDSIPARRAMHCYSEAQRVLDFKKLCEKWQDSSMTKEDNEAVLRQLGEIMNASHDSCRDLYDCSCPELDRLVQVCRSSGSYGSRLTGAGWGGCAVSLVAEEKVEKFIQNVAKAYYGTTPDRVSQKLFVTSPGRAAAYIKSAH